jgi:serine protease
MLLPLRWLALGVIASSFVACNNSPPTGPASISGTLVFPGQIGGSAATNSVPGEVIVKFRVGARPQSLTALRVNLRGSSVALTRAGTLGAALPNTELLRANLSAQDTLELTKQLEARSDVEYAVVNRIYTAKKMPNDPLYVLQWDLRAFNLEPAWDITDGTTNPVRVAVVDSGSITHPDLQGVFLGGYDFVSDTTNSGDGNGREADPTDRGGDSDYHGSHVAGTIAARSNNAVGVAGINWGARVVPVRVLGVNGGGSLSDILAGVQWAAGLSVPGMPANPNPARVINLSLGGDGVCSSPEQAVFDAVKAAGAIAIVAAGNENQDAGNVSPANCSGVITVGATGPGNIRAPYSNYGSRIDVMAPGGDTSQSLTIAGKTYPAGIFSTILNSSGQPAYAPYQGTSMAAPHIAGLVSLMLSRDSSLTFETVLARLKASAAPLSASDCDRPSGSDCGAGLVDAVDALNATNVGTPAPPPPTTTALNTYVAALRCAQPNCLSFQVQGSVTTQVQATRLSVPYTLSGVSAGTYVAAAWQDLNGNRNVDAGEPFGSTDILTVGAGQVLTSITIRLDPAVVNAAPTPSRQRLEAALQQLARR